MCLCVVQCGSLEEEVKSLKEDGGGNFYQTMALPEGMHPSSSDIIASLNEQLLQVLQVRNSHFPTLRNHCAIHVY